VKDDRGTERHHGAVDLDVHGIVGVRLVHASAEDVSTVTRQLGVREVALERKPEILVEYSDAVRRCSRLRSIGLDDAGFDDEGFYVLRGRGRTRTATRIAFEHIGDQVKIVCESGSGAVPLLVPIVNLTALAKGFVPVHASAFSYRGTGVLVTGWTKGGKTETLLGFMANGATYIGDEWVYVRADGDEMYGLPQPITLWDWHLDDLPGFRAGLGWRGRSKLRTSTVVQAFERRAPARVVGSSTMTRVLGLTSRQLYVTVRPQALFGATSCAPSSNLDKVFFLVSHEAPEVTVEPVDPHDVARRMLFSLRYERLDLVSAYLKFRFAFPGASNEVIERADELERDALPQVLADKEAYAVHHPFPAPIPALFDAIAPLL
jgi:hypothetical protein